MLHYLLRINSSQYIFFSYISYKIKFMRKRKTEKLIKLYKTYKTK